MKIYNMSYDDVFTDRMILKLKRKYSKDEEVGLLIQALKAKEVEVGELKSEVAHFKEQYISVKSRDIIGYNRISNERDDLKNMVLGLNGRIILLQKEIDTLKSNNSL